MGERLRHLRALFALVAYIVAVGLVLAFGIAPHMYFYEWQDKRRLRLTHTDRLQKPWGFFLTKMLQAFLGTRIRVEMDPDDLERVFRKRCIVVSNHSDTLDTLVLMAELHRLRIPSPRWVVKRELLRPLRFRDGLQALRIFLTGGVGAAKRHLKELNRTLILWRTFDRGGFPAVGRRGEATDLREIEAKAALAHAEGGSFVIFPEGTRFRGKMPGSPFVAVNPPKSGGFRALVRNLPNLPVLNATISWTPSIRLRGRTMWSGAKFFGASVTVRLTVEGPFADEDAATLWLEEEWRRKDALLISELPN